MMQWGLVIDFAFICVWLFVASILRAKFRFLQRFLIPNAITAGFVGLGLVYLTEHLFPNIMPSREVLGSGLSLFFSFPLLLFINVPALNRTVRIYLLTEVVVLGYIFVLFPVMVATGFLRLKSKLL